MVHFNFVISQNAKLGHAGFYIDCHRMTVPENILLQKSTALNIRHSEESYAENHCTLVVILAVPDATSLCSASSIGCEHDTARVC